MKMKKLYKVRIPEVHYQEIIVEATSKDEAIAAAKNGEGDYVNGTEYAYTLEDYQWYIAEGLGDTLGYKAEEA
tara:strand:- start:2436 stop:2654 length:219 start_codon:yes stop_codon:yes gene_type:complete